MCVRLIAMSALMPASNRLNGDVVGNRNSLDHFTLFRRRLLAFALALALRVADARMPPAAFLETPFFFAMPALARNTKDLGCRGLFFCAPAAQDLFGGARLQANSSAPSWL